MLFKEVALGHSCQAGLPEDCAVSHCNPAHCLERQGSGPADVVAHGLVDAVSCLQSQFGRLPSTLRNRVRSGLPPAPRMPPAP